MAKSKPTKSDLIASLESLLKHAESNHCTHDSLIRGGAIWTLCVDCDARWADDEGGVPKNVHEYPKFIKDARKVLKAIKIKK